MRKLLSNKFCLLILHLFFFLPVFSQHLKYGFELNEDANFVSIPFQLKNNLIIIDVKFQGVIPLKFIVDTGVSNTVLIDRTYADLLDLKSDRKLTIVGAAGVREVEAFIINSVTIDLLGISGHNIPIMVLKEDYLKLEQSIGINVHGILGFDLFKNFIVNVNYGASTITFYKPDEFKRPLWFFHELEMPIENTKPYLIRPVMMEDSTVVNCKLMIDTGASHSLMLHVNSAKEIHLPENHIRDILGAGIAGKIEGSVGRVNKLTLNENVYLDDVIARFPDAGNYQDIIEYTGRNGTIGGGILSRFNVVFDYPHEKLYFKRNSTFYEDFKYDMSGLSIIAKGEIFLEPFYEVERVREGSPAALAGVKIEDIIVSINGLSGKLLNLSDISKIFTSKPNRKVKITVKRGEELLQFEFRLKEVI